MPIFNNNTPVKFKAGTPVTSSSPALEPGAFVYDTDTGALYVDTLDGREQVRDPLKLSLTGGTLTGTLEIESAGNTTASINTSGVITGVYLETTGVIHLNTAPHSYAVFGDDSGNRDSRIQSRTLSETVTDLGIDDKVDADSIESGTVVTSVTAGTLPAFTDSYDGTTEALTLSFSAGTSATVSTSSDFLKNKTV